MSKLIKNMIIDDYATRFKGIEGALVVDIRGVTSNENNTLRRGLQKKNIRVTIVKNTLARKALVGTPLENLGNALEGPSALAYSTDSVVDVAREVIAWTKKVTKLTLKAAILDGTLYPGEAGVKQLSQMPTREEAQARVVSLVLGPAGKVLGGAKSPGAKLMGIVKEIQTRLEDGKTIARLG